MEVPQKINVHLSYDTAVTDSPSYGVAVCVCLFVCVCVCIYSKYRQGRYTEGQQAHEKMINTTHH